MIRFDYKTLLVYKINNASAEEIFKHLTFCKDQFVPPLNEYVDIKSYSMKIKSNALTFEAWQRDYLVGLLAAYFNDFTSKKAFITSLSVATQFQGLGIAKSLLLRCLEYSAEHDFRAIDLEVNKNNKKAIRFYMSNEFSIKAESPNSLILTTYKKKPTT